MENMSVLEVSVVRKDADGRVQSHESWHFVASMDARGMLCSGGEWAYLGLGAKRDGRQKG